MKLSQTVPGGGAPAWFCIRCLPKREHIAASNLGRLPEVEVFNPQLRVRKTTKRGPVWFTESLFPSYIFARFPLEERIDCVLYSGGVNYVIRFGDRYPAIPESVMEELRRGFGTGPVEVAQTFREGDRIRIAGRSLMGLEAVILRVLPSKQRVQVLLELLGRVTVTEISFSSVIAEERRLAGSHLVG